jgi:cytidylate kinase
MPGLIVTIDGPAGSGKSSVARKLAEKLSAVFLDTGAMYRAVTLTAMNQKIDLENQNQLLSIFGKNDFRFVPEDNKMKVYINGEDFTAKIRTPQVTSNAKYIASAPEIRKKLVKMQRQFALNKSKVVTEGRDQGTVVFPDADFKFFLTASLTERAKRRAAQMGVADDKIRLEKIANDLQKRDKSDESRKVAPLKPARDAVKIDTTDLTLEQVVDKLAEIIEYPEK